MDVILLERIEKLGQMGDVVEVKPGFARNYLLPQKKALRATDDNKKVFEAERKQLEAANKPKNGAGALFPAAPDETGCSIYLVPDNLVRSSTSCIISGVEALKAHLKHGILPADPGIQRFQDVETAIVTFFSQHPKRFIVTVRR